MPIPKKKETQTRLSAREKIYNEISSWIIDGTLKPKEKLNEAELANYFSVSRTPVREALQLLADQHLVDMIPARGCYVSEISIENADEVYRALSLIHQVLAKAACDVLTEEDISKLTDLNNKFKESCKKNNRAQMIATDRAFHMYIADMVGNTYLKEYVMQLHIHAYRYETMFAKMEYSGEAHDKIITSLAKKNAKALDRAIDDNFFSGYKLHMREEIRGISND